MPCSGFFLSRFRIVRQSLHCGVARLGLGLQRYRKVGMKESVRLWITKFMKKVCFDPGKNIATQHVGDEEIYGIVIEKSFHPAFFRRINRCYLTIEVEDIGVFGFYSTEEKITIRLHPNHTDYVEIDDRIAFEKPWRKNTRIKIKGIGKHFGDWEFMEEYIKRKQRGW